MLREGCAVDRGMGEEGQCGVSVGREELYGGGGRAWEGELNTQGDFS